MSRYSCPHCGEIFTESNQGTSGLGKKIVSYATGATNMVRGGPLHMMKTPGKALMCPHCQQTSNVCPNPRCATLNAVYTADFGKEISCHNCKLRFGVNW